MLTSNLYTKTLQEFRFGTRRIIHQGGMGSGKTVNNLGVLATLAKDDDGGVTTVTSMSLPHLKGGALRDFETYVYPSFEQYIKKYHKTDHLFTFRSGHIIEFKVFENETTARGPRRKRLFINEANTFQKLIYFQLDSRSEQTLIDYNPSVRFWAHDSVIGQPGNTLIISDHRHNPFLKEDKHREIEGICTFAYRPDGSMIMKDNGEPVVLKGDYELWKVYARGLTGNIEGVIFPNWRIIDESDLPKDEDYVFGIDFGYTNDPTAIIKAVRIGNTLFIKELAYKTGMTPLEISQTLSANGFGETSRIYCEHDGDMLAAIRAQYVGGRKIEARAQPARKGQGSINAGIELLKTYDVVYPNSSTNIHRERGLYVWLADKITGELTNKPIETNNHTFDAIRYAVYSHYLKVELKGNKR